MVYLRCMIDYSLYGKKESRRLKFSPKFSDGDKKKKNTPTTPQLLS